jgi:hypothetical protein
MTGQARIAISGCQVIQNKANFQGTGWRRQAEGDCMGDCAKQSQLEKVSGSTPAPGGDPSRGRLGYMAVEAPRETKPIGMAESVCSVPARARPEPAEGASEATPCGVTTNEVDCAKQSQFVTKEGGYGLPCETAKQSQSGWLNPKSFAGKGLRLILRCCETKPIAGRRLRIGDCGVRIEERKSATPGPQWQARACETKPISQEKAVGRRRPRGRLLRNKAKFARAPAGACLRERGYGLAQGCGANSLVIEPGFAADNRIVCQTPFHIKKIGEIVYERLFPRHQYG